MSKDAFNDGTIGEINDGLSWINAYKNSARMALKGRRREDFETQIRAMEIKIAEIRKLIT